MTQHAPSVSRPFGSPTARLPRPAPPGPIDWLRVAAWGGGIAFSVAVWAGIVTAVLALTG
jgi:hypothetical protein